MHIGERIQRFPLELLFVINRYVYIVVAIKLL